MIIGEDKVIDMDAKRAAVEQSDGRIGLYEISHQDGETSGYGLMIAIIEGPMKRGEDYVRTGVVPHERINAPLVAPKGWTPARSELT